MTINQNLITAEELREILSTRMQSIELVDVRSLEKHQAFNIGGKHIPLDELAQRSDELSKDKLIVTYCSTGGKSRRALDYLLSIGFTNIKSLNGGVTSWQLLSE